MFGAGVSPVWILRSAQVSDRDVRMTEGLRGPFRPFPSAKSITLSLSKVLAS